MCIRDSINIVLDRCKSHNITISRKKLEIGEEIEFAGHVISSKGIRPDPSKFQAIRDFPAPKNIKELRSYMGLANQLSSFIPDLQQCTSNMRKLLSPKNEYIWTPTQEEEFKRSNPHRPIASLFLTLHKTHPHVINPTLCSQSSHLLNLPVILVKEGTPIT